MTSYNILDDAAFAASNPLMHNVMPLLRLASLISAVIALVGCASSEVMNVGPSTYQPVPVSHVEVLYKEPNRPYEVIALIKHEAGWFSSSEKEIQHARELAAEAGADALLISSAQGNAFSDNPQAQGKAIRWK